MRGIVWEDLISAMQYVSSLSGHLSLLSIQQQMVTNMPQYLQLPCIHLFGLMDGIKTKMTKKYTNDQEVNEPHLNQFMTLALCDSGMTWLRR